MEKKCDIFICYRGDNAILAKNFAKYIDKINKESGGKINYGKIWYSDLEVQGNYLDEEQLSSLIGSARYFIAFIYKGFTNGFILENGEINPDCVTAKELVLAEKVRRQSDLNFIFVNMNGEEFGKQDIDNLEKLFLKTGILRDDTLLFYTKQNKNNHDLRQGDDERFYQRLLDGIKPLGEANERDSEMREQEKRLSEADKVCKKYWADSSDIQYFFGREKELNTIYEWLIDKKCRLICLTGMGGIGKSSLILRLCKGLSDQGVDDKYSLDKEYDYIIYVDLLNAPLLSEVIVNIIQQVSDYNDGVSMTDEKNTAKLIERLLTHFKDKRCLIIFDNVESVLRGGEQKFPGQFCAGYEDYELCFSAIGSVAHKSCVILNSREKPYGIARLEKDYRNCVQSYELKALDEGACKKIFETIDKFDGTEDEWNRIAHLYNGNPLALQLLAVHISEVYFGSLSDFLVSKQILIGEINELVEWHIRRLSAKQLEVLLWMALFREPISFSDLRNVILDYQSQIDIASTLQALMTRIPIEKVVQSKKFFLQPVIIEYATGLLINGVAEDIINGKFNYLHNYALTYPKTSENVRELKKGLLLNPINQTVIGVLKSVDNYEEKLKATLQNARETFHLHKNYVAGNVIGLLAQIDSSVANYDFSGLSICGADLQDVLLHDVDFHDSVVENCRFRQTFGPVSSVAISKDGNYIAANEAMGKIHIWRTCDNQIIHNLDGHVSWIFGLTFSFDGKFLASGGEDKAVRLWDLENNESVLLGMHKNSVWSLVFSHDDKYIASGDEDGNITIYDSRTKCRAYNFVAYTEKVFSLSFSNDDSILISASSNGQIKFWDANNGFKLIREIVQPNTTVRCVSFDPENKIFASCGWDGKIKLWKKDSEEPAPFKYFDCNEPLHHLSFHPTEPILVSCGESGTIYVWNYLTGIMEKALNRHKGEVWKIEFSGDGRYLLSGGYDGVLIVWNTDNWTCESLLRGYIDWIQDLAISPNGKTIVSSNGDLTLSVWDLETSALNMRFPAHSGWTFSVEYHPSGRYLASGSDDLKIKLWDALDWNRSPRILNGHKKWIQDVAFNCDGKYLASADDDGILQIWDVESGNAIKRLSGHTSGIWSIVFSPDDTTLASADENGDIILWDWKNERLDKTLKGHKDRIHEIYFLSANTLLSGSEDSSVLIWDLTLGTFEELYKHKNWVMAVVAVKNKYVFSGDKDGCIVRYDLQTKAIERWKAHEAGIWTLVPTHNDRYVVSAGEDGKIMIWDAETLQLEKVLKRKKPYENLNITNVNGLTNAQLETLKQLGAKVK